MPIMEYPKADRVPRRTKVVSETRTVTIASDWQVLNRLDALTQLIVFRPADFALPNSSNANGSLTVRIKNVHTVENIHHFRIAIGTGFDSYEIPNEFGLEAINLSYHPFFYRTEPPACGVEKEETIERAYPPSAIFQNALSLPGHEDIVLFVDLTFRGYDRPDPAIDYGCEGTPEGRIELTYEVGTSAIETEDVGLDLWGEDVCQNIVFLPAIPRRDHPEFNSGPRMIGFSQDRAVDTPIPGQHPIPKGFMELFSAHRTRMVEEEPAFTNAVTHTVRSPWVSLTPDPEGMTPLLIEGIPAIPGTGNTRGTIVARIRGVDTSIVGHHFFVRFGAEDNADSYDIPTDSDHPEFEFFPFFSLVTPQRRCTELQQTLDRAYPPRAVFDNATGAADGPWNLIVALRWQGPGGFYGDCAGVEPMAQIELQYQVFEGPETSTEVCKHSYASVVIGSDGFARGFFCSKQDFIHVQKNQENHYAHPFVNRGTADFSEPTDGQKDFSVSQQVPPGMCGFIGAYHAPRWTELLFYSRRQVCREIR